MSCIVWSITYMKRCLSIDISTVNIDFVVVQESNDVVNIRMRNGMEHYIAPHLFYVTNHNFKFDYYNKR